MNWGQETANRADLENRDQSLTISAIIPRSGLFRVLYWQAVLTGGPVRVGRFDSA